MVSAITGFASLTFLDNIKGKTPVSPAAPTAPAGSQPSAIPDVSEGVQDIVTLLGNDTLIGGNGGSGDAISNLLGGSAPSAESTLSNLFGFAAKQQPDPLQNVYNALQKAPLPAAPQPAPAPQTQTQDTVQNAIATRQAGANAYNKVLLQNGQSLLTSGQSLIA